jgi:hypothetical protein
MDTKPDHLIIRRSEWYGLTVKTAIPLKEGSVIACTNKKNYDEIDGHIQTPYGNLFNSTDDYRDVNCKRVISDDDNKIKIVSIRDINAGEELLCSY